MFCQSGVRPSACWVAKRRSSASSVQRVNDCVRLYNPLAMAASEFRRRTFPHQCKNVSPPLGSAQRHSEYHFVIRHKPVSRQSTGLIPIVSAIADHVAEHALAEDLPEIAARCGAVVTHAVKRRTTVLLLRLRSQIRHGGTRRHSLAARSHPPVGRSCWYCTHRHR